mmetsp:Transcript_14592/g.46382  ORF Transcript_14592/g.46382 Transcript_14592/m.46382 type:complete len:251 (-) Transcript_14592:169-921(-)
MRKNPEMRERTRPDSVRASSRHRSTHHAPFCPLTLSGNIDVYADCAEAMSLVCSQRNRAAGLAKHVLTQRVQGSVLWLSQCRCEVSPCGLPQSIREMLQPGPLSAMGEGTLAREEPMRRATRAPDPGARWRDDPMQAYTITGMNAAYRPVLGGMLAMAACAIPCGTSMMPMDSPEMRSPIKLASLSYVRPQSQIPLLTGNLSQRASFTTWRIPPIPPLPPSQGGSGWGRCSSGLKSCSSPRCTAGEASSS